MQSAAGAGHDYAEPPLLNHQYDEVDFMPRGAPAAAGSSAAAAYRTLEPSDRGVYDDSQPMAGADGGPAASTYEALESNDGHNVHDGTQPAAVAPVPGSRRNNGYDPVDLGGWQPRPQPTPVGGARRRPSASDPAASAIPAGIPALIDADDFNNFEVEPDTGEIDL